MCKYQNCLRNLDTLKSHFQILDFNLMNIHGKPCVGKKKKKKYFMSLHVDMVDWNSYKSIRKF